MELMQASHQWSTRPDDQRFLSLDDMLAHFRTVRDESRQAVIPSRRLLALPCQDNKGLEFVIDAHERGLEGPHAPTHYAFGQLAQLAEAPGGYLRSLPSPLAADCINYGLRYKRGIEDVGVLVQHNGSRTVRAATGPRYGRIWNADVVGTLVERFGDGVTGAFKVPGEFGKDVPVTKANTTLYASDRDMFVFLADEKNRIEIPNRRNGQSGQLARGFFVWNSEVGDKTFGLGTFLFDYVCMNRIVWGAMDYKEVRIRHTASAPDKFLSEMAPAITAYANAKAGNMVQAIEHARKARIDQELDDFLAKRFTARLVTPLKAIHEAEEGRPIESLWDASTAATAYARSITHQDQRVALEREAGKLIKMAA
jgi:hypothetical protein